MIVSKHMWTYSLTVHETAKYIHRLHIQHSHTLIKDVHLLPQLYGNHDGILTPVYDTVEAHSCVDDTTDTKFLSLTLYAVDKDPRVEMSCI